MDSTPTPQGQTCEQTGIPEAWFDKMDFNTQVIIGQLKRDNVIEMEKATKADMGSILGVLNQREMKIIFARFGLDGNPKRTLQNIAEEIGVTKERVRQIQNIGLLKLRRALRKAPPVSSCESSSASE